MKGFFLIFVFLFSANAFAGWDEANAAYRVGDYKTALREYKILAEQGDAKAQFGLGAMYLDGKGIIQDYKSAFPWITKAAEQGHSRAQLFLGIMYDDGIGTDQDNKAAFHWFTKSGEQGNAEAQFFLGIMEYDRLDGTRAHMWWNIAASQGNAEAQDLRDKIENRLPPSQIERAQDLARECVAKEYKNC